MTKMIVFLSFLAPFFAHAQLTPSETIVRSELMKANAILIRSDSVVTTNPTERYNSFCKIAGDAEEQLNSVSNNNAIQQLQKATQDTVVTFLAESQKSLQDACDPSNKGSIDLRAANVKFVVDRVNSDLLNITSTVLRD